MFEILNFLLNELGFGSYFIKLICILGQVSLHLGVRFVLCLVPKGRKHQWIFISGRLAYVFS